MVLEAAAKAAQYGALLLAVGVCAAHWLLLPRAAGDLDPDIVARVERSMTALGLTAAVVVAAATLLRLWTHSVSAFGLSESVSVASLRVIAFESRWGAGWRWQAIAAAALLATSAWNRAGRPAGWPMASLAAIAFCVALPLLGHTEGQPVRVVLHAIHAIGAGVWIGTLSVVAIGERDADVRRALLSRFAPVAFAGAGALVAAGLVMSWGYLGAFSNLWTTAYGEVLAV